VNSFHVTCQIHVVSKPRFTLFAFDWVISFFNQVRFFKMIFQKFLGFKNCRTAFKFTPSALIFVGQFQMILKVGFSSDQLAAKQTLQGLIFSLALMCFFNVELQIGLDEELLVAQFTGNLLHLHLQVFKIALAEICQLHAQVL